MERSMRTKKETLYSLRKQIAELKRDKASLENRLYCYRQTVVEISAQLHTWLEEDCTRCRIGYVLRKIRERCML